MKAIVNTAGTFAAAVQVLKTLDLPEFADEISEQTLLGFWEEITVQTLGEEEVWNSVPTLLHVDTYNRPGWCFFCETQEHLAFGIQEISAECYAVWAVGFESSNISVVEFRNTPYRYEWFEAELTAEKVVKLNDRSAVKVGADGSISIGAPDTEEFLLEIFIMESGQRVQRGLLFDVAPIPRVFVETFDSPYLAYQQVRRIQNLGRDLLTQEGKEHWQYDRMLHKVMAAYQDYEDSMHLAGFNFEADQWIVGSINGESGVQFSRMSAEDQGPLVVGIFISEDYQVVVYVYAEPFEQVKDWYIWPGTFGEYLDLNVE